MKNLLNNLRGNASEINANDAQSELEPILVPGETIRRGFKVFRDSLVFTDHRLIMVNRQGLTGSKVSYHTVLYRSITRFSVETAGTFDADCELTLWISGSPEPISKQFAKGTDVVGIQKLLAYATFGGNLPSAPPPLPKDEFTPEEIAAAKLYHEQHV